MILTPNGNYLGKLGAGSVTYSCNLRFLDDTDNLGFPGGSLGKESTCNAGDTGDKGLIPGLGRSPGEGNGNPLQNSCLENPHGQRSLAGYSPWGCKSWTRLSD